MHLLYDFETKQTRIENQNSPQIIVSEIKNPNFVSGPLNAFKLYYNGANFEDEVVARLKQHSVKTPEEALKQFNEIKELILQNKDLATKFNYQSASKKDFIDVLKKYNPSALYFQKATYQLDPGESLDEVYASLIALSSQSLMKYIIKVPEKNQVVSISTTDGLWNLENEMYFKKIENKSGTKIRSTYSIRKINNVQDFQDFSRFNYPIFEELKTLFDENCIDFFSNQTEYSDGSWKTMPNPLYHFHMVSDNEKFEKLYEKERVAPVMQEVLKNETPEKVEEQEYQEEVEEQIEEEVEESTPEEVATETTTTPAAQPSKDEKKAIKKVKKDKTHVGVGNATKESVEEALTQNETEIHAMYNTSHNIDEVERVTSLAVVNFYDNLVEAKEKELEEFKAAINLAKEEEGQAIKIFYRAIKQGNTLLEAVKQLEASKIQDVTIQVVLERVKSEVLSSAIKTSLLQEKEKLINELEKSVSKSNEVISQLETAKENITHERDGERTKRHSTEKKLYEAAQKINQASNAIEALQQEIISKNTELAEKDESIKQLNEEYDVISADNDKLYVDIKKLQEEIKETKNKTAQLEKEIGDKNTKIKSLDKEIQSVNQENDELRERELELKKEIISKNTELAEKDESISSLTNDLRRTAKGLKEAISFKVLAETLQSENIELRAKLSKTNKTSSVDDIEDIDELLEKLDADDEISENTHK